MLFLGLGTNIGNRLLNMELAYEQINKHLGEIKQKSSIWESEPWGYSSGNKFYNSVCCIKPYSISVEEMMNIISDIEKRIGRKKTLSCGYEDRIIDIDILAFNEQIISCKNIEIPHPKLHQRLFVLLPLKEIAPHWAHPSLGLNIEDLIKKCDDKSELFRVSY